MTDEELIRRGDALAAVQEWTYCCDAEEAIAALPAVTIQQITAEVAKAVPAHDAAIREAALREAAAMVEASAMHGGDDGQTLLDVRDAILALIPKGAADDR